VGESRLKSKHKIFQQCHGQERQKNKLFLYRPILTPVSLACVKLSQSISF